MSHPKKGIFTREGSRSQAAVFCQNVTCTEKIPEAINIYCADPKKIQGFAVHKESSTKFLMPKTFCCEDPIALQRLQMSGALYAAQTGHSFPTVPYTVSSKKKELLGFKARFLSDPDSLPCSAARAWPKSGIPSHPSCCYSSPGHSQR